MDRDWRLATSGWQLANEISDLNKMAVPVYGAAIFVNGFTISAIYS